MTAEPQPVVPGVWMLPFEIGQAYIWAWDGGLTVVDTGIAGSAGAILQAVRAIGHHPQDVREIVLTHYHADHLGGAPDLVARTGAAAMAHRDEAPVIAGARPQTSPRLADFERPIAEGVLARMAPPGQTDSERAPLSLNDLARALVAAGGAEPMRVDREVDDGDITAGGGQIVHVPGHTAGSIALLVPAIGVLFTGDTLASHEGQVIPGVFNVDRAELMRSVEKLASLDVRAACFGHGAPVTDDAASRIRALVGAR